MSLLTDPRFHDYLAVLKGARNGLVYGVKIRLPHAVVMSLLFGRGDLQTRVRWVLGVTKTHALNLAAFAALYKVLLLLQRRYNGGAPRPADPFLAGFVASYLVFHERSAVNEQMVLYVCARVVASLIPRAPGAAPGHRAPVPPAGHLFTAFAALVWGAGMWIFAHRPETFQPGMFHSMTYIYADSEAWSGLRTLLWHNA